MGSRTSFATLWGDGSPPPARGGRLGGRRDEVLEKGTSKRRNNLECRKRLTWIVDGERNIVDKEA
jgi:hypothetical protein